MSEKFDPARGEPLEPQSNGSERNPAEDYKVGPGRPPPDKRWKKGGPSPNPRGRPRKDQSMRPDVTKAFEAALNKKILVPRGDKKVPMTRIEIGFEQLFNQLAKGDWRARRDVLEIAHKLGIDLPGSHKQQIENALAPSHQAILDAFLARRTGAGSIAPASPVLASPELLDDDPAESEPTLPSPPKAATEPEPEPPQKPGVDYPKPFSQMTPLQKRAWYPEWYAEKKNKQ